jgi:hypothetical protein
MASIADIIRDGKGKAGSNSSWEVTGEWTPNGVVLVKHLWHYGTLMLTWRADNPSDPNYLDYCTGWGSVSDQGGMNTAFRVLGIPLRFDRAGGATIVEVNRDAVSA